MNNSRGLFVALIGVFLLFGSLRYLSSPDPTAEPLRFHVLQDQQLLETSFAGSPLLVQFWSISCAICLREMPGLQDLYFRYHPQGLQMVAVAVPSDPPNRIMEFQSRLLPPFPIALDPAHVVYRAFGEPRVTPTFFLLDPTGQIVATHQGAMQESVLENKIINLLRQST